MSARTERARVPPRVPRGARGRGAAARGRGRRGRRLRRARHRAPALGRGPPRPRARGPPRPGRRRGPRGHGRHRPGDRVGRLRRASPSRSRSARGGSAGSGTAWASRSTAGRPCSATTLARWPARRSTRPRATCPRDPILTGISVIDALTTLVRGQKLPVFSSAGLPHLELAAQIAAQANVAGEPFKVVVVAMGLTHADAATMRDVLEARAAAGDLALFVDTADDPVVQRMLAPRVALTVAEHLAFDLGHHVLVVLADMTSYCEAVREVSAARGEIPGRRAYPGLPLQRPRLALRTVRPDARTSRVGHPGPGAHHAGRRHHPSGARPHRLHHRRPDRALARAARHRASIRRSTCSGRCRG